MREYKPHDDDRELLEQNESPYHFFYFTDYSYTKKSLEVVEYKSDNATGRNT